MISRWNYFSITIVMGVVLLMFQMTNVMLERWNHYEENSFVRNLEELPKESDMYALDEDSPDSSRGMVVYIGSRDASAFEVTRQWAVYTKQNFMGCETLEDYLNRRVFAGVSGSTVQPDEETVNGFNAYMERYRALLDVERKAVEVL